MSNLKEIHARVNTDLHKYVKEKAKAQNKTISDVIEDMILHDIKIESSYVDDLANAISSKLNEKMKSMRLAVNENNKLLKVEQQVLNYLLLSQKINMPHDKYGDYVHDIFGVATEKVNEDIKRLQVIKAEQKKKKMNQLNEDI
jgi:hypothetical protein